MSLQAHWCESWAIQGKVLLFLKTCSNIPDLQEPPRQVSKSGYIGVYSRSQNYNAQISQDGRSVSVGTWPTAELAAEAHDRAHYTNR